MRGRAAQWTNPGRGWTVNTATMETSEAGNGGEIWWANLWASQLRLISLMCHADNSRHNGEEPWWYPRPQMSPTDLIIWMDVWCVKWILNVYKCAGAGLINVRLIMSLLSPVSNEGLWLQCRLSICVSSTASLRSIRDEKICSLDTISLLLLKINVMWRRGIILYKLRELSHNSPISSVEHFLDGSVKKIISLSLKLVPWATFNMFKLGGFHFHIQYSTMGLNNSIYFH